MYILSATDLVDGNAGITGSGGRACGVPPQGQFNTMQDAIRSRVESALEIATLSRMECQDTFELTGRYTERRRLRLTNGFVHTIQFVQADGEPYHPDTAPVAQYVDRAKGIIDVDLGAGKFIVRYTSGFLADAGTKVYKDLPDWVQSIALNTMFLWLRSMNRGTAIKDISQTALTTGMIRELHARVYSRYQRPRVDCAFPVVYERRPVSDTPGEWLQW